MSSDDRDTEDFPFGPAAASQPPSARVTVKFGAASHRGCVRANNEDCYLVARASRALETLSTSLPAGDVPVLSAEKCYGFLIADGMGGEAAGEVASRLAMRAVVEHALATADWIMRDVATHSTEIEKRIGERFAAANRSIQENAQRHPPWSGMGTTMTMAVSCGRELFIGHVGDSRAYLFRDGRQHLLTHDHSLAQVYVDSGMLSAQDAANLRLRHVLLRSLGGEDARADVQHRSLQSGDQLLLCTDGLTDLVTDSAIADILQGADSAQAACDELVTAALTAGGKDNVTVVLARFHWPS